jgi:hypothetical protein
MEKLSKTLKAIAEGYKIQTLDDRYILVENPDYRPDNGSDPYLLIDTFNLIEGN